MRPRTKIAIPNLSESEVENEVENFDGFVRTARFETLKNSQSD